MSQSTVAKASHLSVVPRDPEQFSPFHQAMFYEEVVRVLGQLTGKPWCFLLRGLIEGHPSGHMEVDIFGEVEGELRAIQPGTNHGRIVLEGGIVNELPAASWEDHYTKEPRSLPIRLEVVRYIDTRITVDSSRAPAQVAAEIYRRLLFKIAEAIHEERRTAARRERERLEKEEMERGYEATLAALLETLGNPSIFPRQQTYGFQRAEREPRLGEYERNNNDRDNTYRTISYWVRPGWGGSITISYDYRANVKLGKLDNIQQSLQRAFLAQIRDHVANHEACPDCKGEGTTDGYRSVCARCTGTGMIDRYA